MIYRQKSTLKIKLQVKNHNTKKTDECDFKNKDYLFQK